VTDTDLTLRRVERNGVIVCVVMSLLAWAMARGRVDAPLGVVAGGALIAVSYRGIKAGVDLLVAATAGARAAEEVRARTRGNVAIGLVKFFTRYVILAGAAYLMMARLRLPPVAVLAGASSLVVAIILEALRPFRPNTPRNVD
jgi:hypothetical protein